MARVACLRNGGVTGSVFNGVWGMAQKEVEGCRNREK